MIKEAGLRIIILGVGTVLCGYLFLAALPSLIDLLFVIFGLQTALAPSVVYGLFDKVGPGDARAGIASLVIGDVTALVCLLLALAGKELLGVTLGLWSPILVLIFSTTTFLAMRDKKTPIFRTLIFSDSQRNHHS